MEGLAIGGFTPMSTVDVPGHLAAVLFTQGCPWSCRYCHNGHLQDVKGEALSWEALLVRLKRRRGFLEAVAFSGGEPLLQPGLPGALRELRAMGFRTALHTGGSHPERLGRVLPLVDWVGFDLKAPWEGYDRITGTPGSGRSAQESLGLLEAEQVPFELRTTLHPRLLAPGDLERMAEVAGGSRSSAWIIQPFRPQGCRDPHLLEQSPSVLSSAHAEALARARRRHPHTSIHVRGDGASAPLPACSFRRSA